MKKIICLHIMKIRTKLWQARHFTVCRDFNAHWCPWRNFDHTSRYSGCPPAVGREKRNTVHSKKSRWQICNWHCFQSGYILTTENTPGDAGQQIFWIWKAGQKQARSWYQKHLLRELTIHWNCKSPLAWPLLPSNDLCYWCTLVWCGHALAPRHPAWV